MRIVVPGVRERRKIDSMLREFYSSENDGIFLEAMKRLSAFYQMRTPKVVWRKKIERGRTYGITYANGRIHLIRPRHWSNSEDLWISVLYHEFGHYVTWARVEEKADLFDQKFRRGL